MLSRLVALRFHFAPRSPQVGLKVWGLGSGVPVGKFGRLRGLGFRFLVSRVWALRFSGILRALRGSSEVGTGFDVQVVDTWRFMVLSDQKTALVLIHVLGHLRGLSVG